MKKNVHNAVGIIAALSLLLGLSLGQLHEQYQTIRQSKASAFPEIEARPFVRSGCGWNMHRHRRGPVNHTIDQLQSQIELEKAILAKERARVLKDIERIQQEMELNRTHVILREEP